MANRNHIVIAGAGFGGVRVALELSKSSDFEITLINKTPYHTYQADLYEVATAILPTEKKSDFKNLSGTTNIPLEKIFERKKVKVCIDSVTEVNLEKNFLKTEEGQSLNYDYLVLSLGGITSFFGIAGADKYTHPLKNTADAMNIRNDLDELISKSDKPISIVIAGGGFAGVELAGELSRYLVKLAKFHKKDTGRLTVIERSEALLGGMPEWAQQLALKRLQNWGVNIIHSHAIEKVEQNKIYCDGGEVIDFDYLIWTTGIKGAAEGIVKGVEITKKAQIKVNPDLSLEKYPNVFVVGDLAECLDESRGCPVASTAWAAISQATVAAQNIKKKVNGLPTNRFTPPVPAFVVPIGSKFALSNIFNLQITGVVGWGLKKLISLKYLLSILPTSVAFSMWWKGVKIYNNND